MITMGARPLVVSAYMGQERYENRRDEGGNGLEKIRVPGRICLGSRAAEGICLKSCAVRQDLSEQAVRHHVPEMSRVQERGYRTAV